MKLQQVRAAAWRLRWIVAVVAFSIVADSLCAWPDAAAKDDDPIPDEVRATYDRAVADQANQIKRLKDSIANTQSMLRSAKSGGDPKVARTDQARLKALRNQLDQIKKSPVPPELTVETLAVGQIASLENKEYKVKKILSDTKMILVEMHYDNSGQTGGQMIGIGNVGEQIQSGIGSREKVEGRSFAVSGVPTKGYVTGSAIAGPTALFGMFLVEKTESYGSATIFSLTTYDAKKLQGYFVRLKAEHKAKPAPANPKQKPTSGTASPASPDAN